MCRCRCGYVGGFCGGGFVQYVCVPWTVLMNTCGQCWHHLASCVGPPPYTLLTSVGKENSSSGRPLTLCLPQGEGILSPSVLLTSRTAEQSSPSPLFCLPQLATP